MNRLAEEAVLLGLASRLWERDSWCGETHIQKASYLLSELRDIDFDFDFILYKHGPFSFELRDELTSMRAEGLLESVAPDRRYGPRLAVTPAGEKRQKRFTTTMARYERALDWIAETIGSRGVVDLERLATAMWVTREDPGATPGARVQRLVSIKPHIDPSDAEEAFEEIDSLLAQTPA